MKSPMHTTLAITAVLAAATAVNGALIVYDGFNYAVDSTLAGNPGWTSLNTGTAPVIAVGNLTVSGLAAPAGNHVSTAGGNIQEALNAIGQTISSGTIYYSFALQLTSLPTTATYSFALATGNTNYSSTVWFRADGAQFNIGLANRSNSTPEYDTQALSLDTTYFLVGAYEFVDGTGTNVSTLWINPDASSFGETAPAYTLQATGGTDMTSITQFLVRGASGSPAFIFDELRIGTTWAEVTPVPEPSHFALAAGLLGLGLILLRRRR
jgi:MYXO-CTERM domain-containing protein